MAKISSAQNEKVQSIARWRGLNECPDGDTRLKIGEAAEMVNWKITRDGNLKRRPGKKLIADLEWHEDEIAGMWTGYVAGKETFLVAHHNTLYSIWDEDTGEFLVEAVGVLETEKGVSFFPFDTKVYILNGFEYYVYDGDTLEVVEGYRPLIAVTIGPIISGEGDTAGAESGQLTSEYINRLNGKRRVWISPDGEHNTFKLPEAPVSHIDWVRSLDTGNEVPGELCWADEEKGEITFYQTPTKGVNSYEIAYTVETTYRSQVTGNMYAELFSGTTDTRVFIYGDGTNKALYSGMDYDGMPRADYFPDQYEVLVGDSNTPITSMIRHHSSLICYKPNECWSLQHGVVELATADLTPAIYVQPVNRDVGNEAPGQVRLVNNDPITTFGTELYQWSNTSYFTSALTRDERQAQRISDRIQHSIRGFDLESCIMWDDNDNQEFYVVDDGVALVWNYVTDSWYRYENFDAACMCNFQGEVYLGTHDGKLYVLTYSANDDDGEPIESRWVSGAMDFGSGYSRKYSSMMWVGLKPEAGATVDVCVETDRKDTFRDKVISSEKAKVQGEPFMVRTKIKAKKFVYYRLILEQSASEPAVTITNVDFRVRETGYAK